MARRGNVLFITLDQLTARVFEGDWVGLIETPALDRLREGGTDFRQHFTVTVPCGPARASLLTGLYAMNHRSIRNGTPLARHHATFATHARTVGYEPLLFGYTDTTADPTGVHPEDPDLTIYEGVAPGFRELVEMRLDEGREWPAYLRQMGYSIKVPDVAKVKGYFRGVTPEGASPSPLDPALYAAAHSETAYLTDRTLAALDVRRDRPWLAHVAYIRPHPPMVAPAPYNKLVDPEDVPPASRTRPDHPFVDAWFSAPAATSLFHGFDGNCDGLESRTIAQVRAIYLGLIAEVDHHIGRLLDWLETTEQADETLVIVTSDHGEMLGEKAMWGKESVFDPAFHVPLIIRAPGTPGGGSIEALTESVDLAPTILDWIGLDIPPEMDGASLLPFVRGETPQNWRDAVLMEADFGQPNKQTRFQQKLGLSANQSGVALLRSAEWKYIHFGGGVPPMLFDLTADPEETRDLAGEPASAARLGLMARALIDRMTERRDRRLTHHAIGV